MASVQTTRNLIRFAQLKISLENFTHSIAIIPPILIPYKIDISEIEAILINGLTAGL